MIETKQMLRIEHVSKDFPGVKALDDVSMTVHQGEVHALLGENGAGKSTLIKIIAGVYQKDEGRIFLNEKECFFSSPADAFRRGLAVIHQETSLIPELTVVQNVFLGLELIQTPIRILNDRAMKDRYEIFCEKIGFFIDPSIQVKELSVAEKKIVEILKALVREASVIIMDEPTDSLTKKEIERLYTIIRDLKKHQVTIIYITHYMDEVFDITDRATVMKDGKHVLTDDVKNLTTKDIISAMVGRDIKEEVTHELSGRQAGIALEVRGLCSGELLRDITFNAHYGEILGITGVIGSGKTELARALFGADSYSSGEVLIDGKSIRLKSPRSALRHGIGMIPEDRKTEGLILTHEIYKNITLSLIEKNRAVKILKKKRERHQAEDLKRQLNIKASNLDSQVKYLSGGNQQKVVIAKWLLADPATIILDEPTRGVDVGAKEEIYKIIKSLSREGRSVIFISSEIPEIVNVADRILLMKNGRVARSFNRGVTQKELFHAMLEESN